MIYMQCMFVKKIFCPCLRGSSASVLSSLSSDVWSHIAHEDLSLRCCYSGRMWCLEPGYCAGLGSNLDPKQTKSLAWICCLDQAANPESQANSPSSIVVRTSLLPSTGRMAASLCPATVLRNMPLQPAFSTGTRIGSDRDGAITTNLLGSRGIITTNIYC
jgi:hypothetical protein